MATKKDQAVAIERVPLHRYEFQAAQSDTEAGRFSGVASVFGSVVDTFPNRTRFRPGAFLKSINDRGSRIKILSQHDQGSIWIGLPTSLRETGEGLLLEASLNNTQLGRDAAEALKHAVALGKLDSVELSIGFDALNFEMVEQEDGEILREVTEARLWEVSLVNFGADRQTRVFEAAKRDMDRQFKEEDPMGFVLAALLSQIPELAASSAPSEGHAGRVLSTKNVNRIKDAVKALNELLELAEPQDDEGAADEGTLDTQALDMSDDFLDSLLAEAEATYLEIHHGVRQ